MLFDPPNRQIAKTTLLGITPPNPGASFDQVLLRPVFSGKSYEVFFIEKREPWPPGFRAWLVLGPALGARVVRPLRLPAHAADPFLGN